MRICAAQALSAASKQLVLFGVLIECALLSILFLEQPRTHFAQFLSAFTIAFAVYALSLRLVIGNAQARDDRQALIWVVVFALLFRLTLLPVTPWLSEDIFRYLWDARVLGAGINPYRYVPGAEELAPLRDALYAPINHKDIGTPYGPLSLMVFWLSQLLGHSIFAMKAVFVACDMAIILLLVRMLADAGLPVENVAVYAWNPLVLVEVAGNGHNDGLAVLFLLLALHAAARGRSWWLVAAFSLSSFAKYLALLAWPALWNSVRAWQWVLFPVLAVLLFAPFATHLENHILHVITVGASWRFNDSVFWILHQATGSDGAAMLIAGLLFLGVCVVVARRRTPPILGVLVLIGASFCLTTTLQPWYLVWIVPLLCFHPNHAWLLLTGLIILSYHVLIDYDASGTWAQNPWLKLVMFVPFYGLLVHRVWGLLRR